MDLNDALKIPGVWWLVYKGHQYRADQFPTKFEVIEVLKNGTSLITINDKETIPMKPGFVDWEAYSNFWLAWAAMRRSGADGNAIHP